MIIILGTMSFLLNFISSELISSMQMDIVHFFLNYSLYIVLNTYFWNLYRRIWRMLVNIVWMFSWLCCLKYLNWWIFSMVNYIYTLTFEIRLVGIEMNRLVYIVQIFSCTIRIQGYHSKTNYKFCTFAFEINIVWTNLRSAGLHCLNVFLDWIVQGFQPEERSSHQIDLDAFAFAFAFAFEIYSNPGYVPHYIFLELDRNYILCSIKLRPISQCYLSWYTCYPRINISIV